MPRPHDCSHAELELDECPYCVDAHAELLERLRDDGAVTMATVASWAIYEERVGVRAVWRVG